MTIEEKDEKKYRETLLINDELNPKLVKVLKEWYDIFTSGEKKMDAKGVAKFIQGVSESQEEIDENESRVTDFIEKYDKDKKGYVSEEEFIEFYQRALDNKKTATVWKNLKNMGVRKDLRKNNEPFEIIFNENTLTKEENLVSNISTQELNFDSEIKISLTTTKSSSSNNKTSRIYPTD